MKPNLNQEVGNPFPDAVDAWTEPTLEDYLALDGDSCDCEEHNP